MSKTTTVSGEDLEVLVRAIRYINFETKQKGRVRINTNNIPDEIVVPFARALMRREARLLTEDADEMSEDPNEWRTHDQRRADAFLDLIVSISAATRYAGPSERNMSNDI